MNGCWTWSNAFSATIEMIMWFLTFLLLMWCMTLIDLHMLNHPCEPGMNPTWSWCMIFSIICEETGLFGALLLLGLFAFLIIRLYMLSVRARDLEGSLLLAGIMTHIALQVILNVAVVTNSIPNTGITLPFISYGGTSIVFLHGELGMALAVSRQIPHRTDDPFVAYTGYK